MAGESSKTWLQRPEGKFGTAITVAGLAAAGGAVLYFWGLILPWLIMVLTNTLYAVGLAAALAMIGVVLFDKRWRNLGVYAYKSLMRAITGAIIEIDPIGILKTYVEKLRKRLADMDESIENLAGQLKKLGATIERNAANRERSLKLANEAHKRGDEMRNVFVLQSRQAGRLQKSNMTLQNLYDRMSNLMRVLKKMREASGLLVEDIQGEVEVKSAERAALLAGYSAFSNAKKIMQGGGDEKEMFDMTMEKLADDYGMKMGEIEMFMDMSKSVIDGVDLDNGIYEADALAQLEAWEQKSTSLLLSSPPPNGGNIPNVRIGSDPGVRIAPAVDNNDYSDLFENPSDDKHSAQR